MTHIVSHFILRETAYPQEHADTASDIGSNMAHRIGKSLATTFSHGRSAQDTYSLNVGKPQQRHHKTIHAKRNPCCRANVIKNGKKTFIKRIIRLIQKTPFGSRGLKPTPLFFRIAKLRKAVCKLKPIHVEFPAFSHITTQFRQACRLGRIVHEKDRTLILQSRLDLHSHVEIKAV